MRPNASRPLFSAEAAPRLELLLYTPERQPWVLSLSPGMERFIGAYQRIDGIDAGTPLLEYRAVQAAADGAPSRIA
jgi:hypothetical protein